MSDYDQDAVNAAVAVLQPQIDVLTARPVGKQPVKYAIHYDDGSVDIFKLASA